MALFSPVALKEREPLPNVVEPAWLTATPNYEFLEVKGHLCGIKSAWEGGRRGRAVDTITHDVHFRVKVQD